MTLCARTPGKTWKPNCLGDVQPGIEARLLELDGVESVEIEEVFHAQRGDDIAVEARETS